MIKEFIERWEINKNSLRTSFSTSHPESYENLVQRVISILEDPDPERIHKIDDGDYQGTLVFVIGEKGYQPSAYWYVKVEYGSCSGCDTLESIRSYSDETPTEEQVNDYMTLALHIVQGLKLMGSDD